MKEQTLFQSNEVTVTNARLEIGKKMYSIAHIVSIETKNLTWSAKLAGLGSWSLIASLIAAYFDKQELATVIYNTAIFNITFSIPLIVVGVVWTFMQKVTHTIFIKTSNGETRKIKAEEEAIIVEIESAIKKAIVSQSEGGLLSETYRDLCELNQEIRDREKVLN